MTPLESNTVIKILMLEDNLTDVEHIRRLLLKEKMNFEINLAMNKDTFLLALDKFRPDIILSDHSLPQFNSHEAFSVASERAPDIPFIVVTSTVSDEYAANMIKMGVDDYILKDSMIRLPVAIITSIQRRNYEKEKRESEQRIARSETNLKTIFENTSEGFVLLDSDTTILAFNHRATEYILFSKVQKFQIDQCIYNFVEESRKEFFKEIINSALNGESTQYDRSYEIENGRTAWIDFSVTPVRENGKIKGVCIAGRDVTEKKLMEQKILDYHVQEQKKITRAIITAQEKERTHLGQELHDNINQILASTKLHLEMAACINEEMKKLMTYPIEMINLSIEEIRLLSNSLVTPLKDIDLEELIRNLLSGLKQNTTLKTRFSYSVSNKFLPNDLQLNIYRILQEQLTNIVKHAAAKSANVSIQTDNRIMSVVVEDDGKGFDVNKERKGIGISNMMNRIESFNGEVLIESSPGKGCKIVIKVPY